VQALAVFVEDRVAFGFANALDDDLLRRLRGDAAKVFGRHFFIEEVAGFVLRARFFARDFEFGIGHLIGDGAAMVDLVLARVAIDRDDGIRFTAEVSFVRRD